MSEKENQIQRHRMSNDDHMYHFKSLVFQHQLNKHRDTVTGAKTVLGSGSFVSNGPVDNQVVHQKYRNQNKSRIDVPKISKTDAAPCAKVNNLMPNI